MIDLNTIMLKLLAGVFAALCGGTLVRIVALRKADPEIAHKRMGSLRVWWTLAVLLSLAIVFGKIGVAILMAVASALGLREYLRLIGTDIVGMPATVAAYMSVAVQYTLIATGCDDAAGFVLPISGLLLISACRLHQGRTEGFICATAGVYWGVMLLVYGLSHAVMLFSLPAETIPPVGIAGWFLFVVIVTETDDIAQALFGRIFGRHKITPRISPNKTWEGFAGGVVTSIGLSLLLTPWLTSLPSSSTFHGLLLAIATGLLVVVAAFLGDINMSAIKRDAGVKDGSALLPGMGGVIDRIDSLTFTAPVFYYFVRLVL